MLVPIVLAEPHPVARAALTALLSEDGTIEVVPASRMDEAMREVARRAAPILIVSRRLLDFGTEGMRLPGPLPPGTRTIVVGLENDPAFATDARRSGAAAYVVKDRADRELRAAIDRLLDEHEVTTTWRLSA
jgi:two-component system, NarL family, response regulator NreC